MALQIRDYKKAYNDDTILEFSNLNLEHGIYWFKGDNGSGKSTLFKSISGLIPFEGDISFNGFNIWSQQSTYRRQVSYSEAEPSYPHFLSQKDLIAFYAKTMKATSKQVEHLIEVFGTSGFLQNPISSYSSGMLKKTGLLLAFIGAPKLVILDEPFITIDKDSTTRLEKLIISLYEEGSTFLISSHTQESLSRLPLSSSFLIENRKLRSL